MSEVSTGDERTIIGFGTFELPEGSEKNLATVVEVTDRNRNRFRAVLFQKEKGKFSPVQDYAWNRMVRDAEGDILIGEEGDVITVIIKVRYVNVLIEYDSRVMIDQVGESITITRFKYSGGPPGR